MNIFIQTGHLMKTIVVNINEKVYEIFIGRPSIWGNPYRIGRDGTRQEVLEKYYHYVKNSPYLMSKIHQLKGKILGCYCKPKDCHGDMLVKILEEIEVENFMRGSDF